MKTTKGPKDFLNADFKKEDAIWLTSSATLRKTIGILGMALPVLIYVFLFIDSGWGQPLDSISHYYYTRVSGIFIATLSILGLFLMIYRGKERIDLIISTLAGIAALFVVFFPTTNLIDVCCDSSKKYCVTMITKNTSREVFHFVSAGIFLGCLAYMSIFLFTKSDKDPKDRGTKKGIRNGIYITCGILMILAMVVVFFGAMEWIPKDFYIDHHLTFWMEALAVESFGFAWLVKGETLFKD